VVASSRKANSVAQTTVKDNSRARAGLQRCVGNWRKPAAAKVAKRKPNLAVVAQKWLHPPERARAVKLPPGWEAREVEVEIQRPLRRLPPRPPQSRRSEVMAVALALPPPRHSDRGARGGPRPPLTGPRQGARGSRTSLAMVLGLLRRRRPHLRALLTGGKHATSLKPHASLHWKRGAACWRRTFLRRMPSGGSWSRHTMARSVIWRSRPRVRPGSWNDGNDRWTSLPFMDKLLLNG